VVKNFGFQPGSAATLSGLGGKMSGKKKWTLLCEFAEQSRNKYKVPGVVLGVLFKGKVKTAGFGVTNVDHPLDVTDKTLFQIGSITKTFTGTLVMKLVEAGKIDLDATVRNYLPDFKVADQETSQKVTIRHLMTHMSGWFGDFFHDTGAGDDAPAKYVAEMANLVQLAPIDTVWSYNNAGFYLLGQIIETILGKSYQQALREDVLEPLGLKNTFFDPGDVITHRFATGHNGGQVARPWPLPRAAYPAGGITCDVHDLLAYAKFHMGDGTISEEERLLEKESLAKMQTPQANVWKEEHWGLTWAINDTYQTRLVSHGGGTTGQVSQLIFAPEREFAIAVFTNAGEGGQVTLEVTREALKAYLGIEITDSEPMEVKEEELAQYTGSYSRPFSDIHLGLLGGRLIGQLIYKMGFPAQDSPPPPPPPPVTIGLCEKDRLLVLDGPMKSAKAEILRKEDGSIGWLRFGRIHKKQD
jgi:CubicO group peptidase (beta-lactamase class C family)